MITNDLGAELQRALHDAVATGQLPEPAADLSAAGTWRPVTAHDLGTYATSLPFQLARLTGRNPRSAAESLAEHLRALDWVSEARATGHGYLTITVTTAHLARLPGRILADTTAAVGSAALAGRGLTAPRLPDLATAPTWVQAWQSNRDALVGRLARAAGAEVLELDFERSPPASSMTSATPGPVADAVRYYGVDLVRYTLARTASPSPGTIERQICARHDLLNPFVAVSYARADAASTRRWAADLGLDRSEGVSAAGSAAFTHPAQLALLDALAWLPERVAAAARRRRPAELAGQLEFVAGGWLDCRESCPALPFFGRGAPADPGGDEAMARIELADASAAALAAGLGLLGVAAPARLLFATILSLRRRCADRDSSVREPGIAWAVSPHVSTIVA